MKILLTILSMGLFTFIYGQSTPSCFKAYQASFKKASADDFTGPLNCDDIVLINYSSKEIELISGSCTVYKIISTKFVNGKESYLQINAQDRKNNNTIFEIYSEIKNGFPEFKIVIIGNKNNMTSILNVKEKTVF